MDLLVALTSSAPALIVLDDLHWAQHPTLRLLEHVVRSPRLERLCIVATARNAPNDRTDAFARAFPTIARLHAVDRVDIEPFDEGGVRRFVASATGTLPENLPRSLEAVVQQLTELSAGNAFFLTESWQQLLDSRHLRHEDGRWSLGPSQASEAPRSVREMVSHRLTRLADRARRVVQLAACSGVSFDVHVIARRRAPASTTSWTPWQKAPPPGSSETSALDERHSSTRWCVSRSKTHLPASDRARCHLALATGLLDTGDAEPTVLARHFTAAVPLEPPSTAVHYARLAAQRSIETVSFDDAIGSVARRFDGRGRRPGPSGHLR